MTRLSTLFAAAFAALAGVSHAADLPKTFKRGAHRSPAHHLLAAPRYRVPEQSPPAQFAIVPQKLDMWGNDQYGDCVTAEEAFAKACYSPEIFIDPSEVVRWARSNGYLRGADLASVMQSMQRGGFQVAGQQYDDGPYASVDYSNEAILQSAIASSGPVKIAIDADALPDGAGNQQGWYATAGGSYPNTDHCVSLCGYGPAGYLYSQLNVPLPAALPASTPGYLLYTWSTIGFVSHDWLKSTCAEAWVRNPVTVGNPPLSPAPNPDPAPAPPPAPGPTPGLSFSEAVQAVMAISVPNLTDAQKAKLENFFGDGSDALPRVRLLRDLVYRRAVRAGAIPAGTPIETVDWQGLIEFLQALAPLIEQLMLLFGGEQQALLDAPIMLCAAGGYRTECGPYGCRRVPIETPTAKAEVQNTKPAPRPACRCVPSRRRFKLFRAR